MGRRVPVEIRHTTIQGRDAIEATCTDCGHVTTSFGDSDRSVRRCLAMMREECPEGEDNFYVEDDE